MEKRESGHFPGNVRVGLSLEVLESSGGIHGPAAAIRSQ